MVGIETVARVPDTTSVAIQAAPWIHTTATRREDDAGRMGG
jgi:hypothetical protein